MDKNYEALHYVILDLLMHSGRGKLLALYKMQANIMLWGREMGNK
jgi:hypothetical protein